MAHPHTDLIRQFYLAFQQRDARSMAACYNRDAVFSDPAFGTLHGDEIAAMWQMLTTRAEDFSLTFGEIDADEHGAQVDWVAVYRFSQTGRRVVNRVHARFSFADGRIATHEDRFDLYRWARQALGVKGLLLGWLPPVQAAIRQQARTSLARYREKQQANAGG
ncbi:nuclear transport factor 2 family protein [Silvimonas sp. JCM 19000]